MPKILGKYLLGEGDDVQDDEADIIFVPTYHFFIFRVLLSCEEYLKNLISFEQEGGNSVAGPAGTT